MTSLNLLNEAYGGSSDSTSDTEDAFVENSSNTLKLKLPLPREISSMFGDPDQKHSNLPKHDGRIRSFEHVRGNWATYVCIPYPELQINELKDSSQSILTQIKNVQWNLVEDVHLSISKTVTIPHHEIEPMVDTLRDNLRNSSAFSINFSSNDLKYYVNEEKTRSFCGFEVTLHGTVESVQKLVEKVDLTLLDFKCDTYYPNPSYHMSIAWCLGDISKDESKDTALAYMKQLWKVIEDHNPHLFSFVVKNIVLKSGNKQFMFFLL
ncbi:U6 snRNA phosphodiesterase 1-like isoform X1 [Clavelina lepadiformis]|uniref:U6 snRNA phosphodiesterase 1-like isoform X1 n=1 Tax=Clavelina lepadiformis TaxID=159417 RepID=UPI00404363EE